MTNPPKPSKERVCKELSKAIKQKPFFDVVGGCGVDLSGGESNCMDRSGVWFKYCPFCGKEIVSEYKNDRWSYYEKV